MTTDCNESAKAGLGAAHGCAASDAVNHPPHYTQHPSGVECIQVTECMNFCLGNAVKYIWRADLKNDAIEDLEVKSMKCGNAHRSQHATTSAKPENDFR